MNFRLQDTLLFLTVVLSIDLTYTATAPNTNHSKPNYETETVLFIPHTAIFGPKVHGHNSLSSGLMHILSSTLFQPTLKLFGTAPLFSPALSEALGCVSPCTCKLDFLTKESEMVCRGMLYPELLGAFLNASASSSTKNNLNYPSTTKPVTNPEQGNVDSTNDIYFNDLWKRNRGRENRERSRAGPLNTMATPQGPQLINSEAIDGQKNYYETAYIDGRSKNRDLKFSSLTFTFNSIPVLKRELFTALRHLDSSPNGLSSVRELNFYYNKIKGIDSDAFLDFEIMDDQQISNADVGINRLKIIEHSWHTDPQDYFSGFPHIALSPLKHSLEDIQIGSPNIGSVPMEELSQFFKLQSLTVKSSGLKSLIGNSTYQYSTSRLPPLLSSIHLSTDSMDRIPKLLTPALNVTYFSLTSTILEHLFKEDFINNLPALKELYILDSNLSIIAFDAFYPLKSTLKILDLRGNKIVSLDDRIFSGLTELRSLDLSGNELTILNDGIFKDLINLETLSLKYNRITKLGDVMDLEGARFNKAGASMFKLLLKSNSLTSLPVKMLKALPELKWLDLSKNRISHIPATAFANNKKLENLDISANLLTALDVGCFSGPAKTLFILKLYHNQITKIETNVLSSLENLTQIDISYNKLTTLDTNLFSKSQDRLTYMDIAFNPWHCDCKMKEFRMWLESHISNLYFLHRFKARTILNRAKCESPPNLAGVPLSYPPLNAFDCQPRNKSPSDGKHRATLISEIDISSDPGYNFSANFNTGETGDQEVDSSEVNTNANPNLDSEPSEGILLDTEEQEYTNKELTAALFRQQTIDSMIIKEIKELYDTMLHLLTEESANKSSYLVGLEGTNQSYLHSSSMGDMQKDNLGAWYSHPVKDILKQTYSKGVVDQSQSRTNPAHLARISIILSITSMILIALILAFTLLSSNRNKSWHDQVHHQPLTSPRSTLSKPSTALSTNGQNNGLNSTSEYRESNGYGVDDSSIEYTSYNPRHLSALSASYSGSTNSLASRTSRNTLNSSKFNQWTSGYKRHLWRAPLLGPLFRPKA